MSNSKRIDTVTDTDLETEFHSPGVNMTDLVRITFLEQSARYLGVYCHQDQSETTHDDNYWIN